MGEDRFKQTHAHKQKQTKAAWTIIKIEEVQSYQPLCAREMHIHAFVLLTINILL